jgi:hypothetical protein
LSYHEGSDRVNEYDKRQALRDITLPIVRKRPELRDELGLLQWVVEKVVVGTGRDRRKLTGIREINHSLGMAQYLADYGARLVSVIGVSWHDWPEKVVRIEKKRGNQQPEEELTRHFVDDQVELLGQVACDRFYWKPRQASDLSSYLRQELYLVTPLKDAIHYKQYAKLVQPSPEFSDRVRASVTKMKLVDRDWNTNELLILSGLESAPWFMPDSMYLPSIDTDTMLHLYEDGNFPKVAMTYAANQVMRHRKPRRVPGNVAVNNFWKNYALVNALRSRDASFPEDERSLIKGLEMLLVEHSKEKSRQLVNSLFTFDVNWFRAHWYMKEMNRYAQQKDAMLKPTSSSKDSMFDGTIETRLDPLVHGEGKVRKMMRKKKHEQAKALLVLYDLFTNMYADPNSSMSQITENGVEVSDEAVGRTRNIFYTHLRSIKEAWRDGEDSKAHSEHDNSSPVAGHFD